MVSFMSVNYRHAGHGCLLPLTPALSASTLPSVALSMPVLYSYTHIHTQDMAKQDCGLND